MKNERSDVDVVIVGGGMVGAALACALARQAFSVALIERRPPLQSWPAGTHDIRVSAISRASQNIFRHLQAWEPMCQLGVTAYEHMRVWESGGPELHFDAADIGEADLGHIIENRVIQAALWQRMAHWPHIQIHAPAHVTRMQLDENRPRLWLDDGQCIQGALIVAADGARSSIRELAGIGTAGWSYEQTAVVCTVHAERGNQATCWQRFMPTGPLALLPLETELFSIVWSTSPEQAQQLVAMDGDAFSTALTRASEYRAGDLRLQGTRGAFPLRLQHASRYIAPGLALVGDAAHVIHPLAGQGVNLGLLDMAELVDRLVWARNNQRPLGSLFTLRRYERARKGENLMMQGAMDAFKRLFSPRALPLRLARQWGMRIVEETPVLKHVLIRTALGTQGQVPSLAQRF